LVRGKGAKSGEKGSNLTGASSNCRWGEGKSTNMGENTWETSQDPFTLSLIRRGEGRGGAGSPFLAAKKETEVNLLANLTPFYQRGRKGAKGNQSVCWGEGTKRVIRSA